MLCVPAFAVPSPPAGPPLDIEAYDVDGNTILSELALEQAVYPFLGPERTRADVDRAREALEDAYHARGYDSVVVELPRQDISDKVVKLHVVEAPVGRLRVVGARYYSLADIKRGAPGLAEGSTPNFHQAQAELNELNRLPERQITPVVTPGLVPGTVDVDLRVTDQEPLHASVDLTNDHSPNTLPLRLTANVHYDNLWQLGQSLSLTYAVAPQDPAESQVEAGSYLAPVPHSSWSLLLYGYTSDSNVATIGDVAVLGKGYAVGLRAIDQLPQLGAFTESLSIGVDFKHFYQLVNVTDVNAPPTESAIAYEPLTAVYTLQSQTGWATNHASVAATLGIRTRADDQAQFETNRAYANGNFAHLNLDIEETFRMPFGAQSDLHFTGQLADGPLLSGEQFAAGGFTSVRGYLQAQAVGDDAVDSMFELRSPLIAVAPGKYVDDWRLFAFADAADTWILDPLAGQTSQTPLYSAGIGTHLQLFKYVDSAFVVAFPLKSVGAVVAGRPYPVFNLKAGF